MAAGLLICCTCPPAACASGPTVLTSCTGKKLVRLRMNISGSGSGSATKTEGIDLNAEGGDGTNIYSIRTVGEYSFSVDGYIIVDADSSDPLQASISELRYDVDEDSVVTGDFALLGTISGSASCSYTLNSVDDGELGSGSATPTGASAGVVSAGISVNRVTGAIAGTLAMSWSAQFEVNNPVYFPGRLEKFFFSVGGNVSITFAGDSIDVSTICEQAVISASTISAFEANASATAAPQTAEWEGETDNSSEGEGDGEVTAVLTTAAATEAEDPLTVSGCSRFITIDIANLKNAPWLDPGHVLQPPVGGSTGATGVASVTGRLALATVLKCGRYYPTWEGEGVYTYVTDTGGGPVDHDIDCTIALAVTVIGPEGVAGTVTITTVGTVTRFFFTATDICVVDATITPFLRSPLEYSGTQPGNGLEGSSLTIGEDERAVGDPTYYCEPECSGVCTDLGSSLGMIVSASAAGSTVAINEAVIVTKTASKPCAFHAMEIAETGPLLGNNMTYDITFDTDNWWYVLTIRDDEDSVILTAHTTCLHNKQLGSAPWIIDTHPGLFAEYTDLAVGWAA